VADELSDGLTRVSYFPTCANIASPTVVELNAGILLQWILTPDGLIGFEPDTGDVPTSALASVFNTVDNGRISFSNTMLRLKKQTTGDTTYSTLGTIGVTGYIGIRMGILEATGWASAQPLRVLPIKTGMRRDLTPAENEVRKYEVPLKIWITPNLNALVA